MVQRPGIAQETGSLPAGREEDRGVEIEATSEVGDQCHLVTIQRSLSKAIRCPDRKRAELLRQIVPDEGSDVLVQQKEVGSRIQKRPERGLDSCRPELDVDPRLTFAEPWVGVSVDGPPRGEN